MEVHLATPCFDKYALAHIDVYSEKRNTDQALAGCVAHDQLAPEGFIPCHVQNMVKNSFLYQARIDIIVAQLTRLTLRSIPL